MALIKHPWTLLDIAAGNRGSTPLASSLRPADPGATAGTPAQKPTSSRTAFRLFGRGLSAIVRRPTNGGGPLIWPMRHSAFARLTPELRLARQPKSQQVREPRFAFSGEGCPP